MTVALLHSYGVAGFAAEKAGIALIFLLVYVYQRPRWDRANIAFCFVVLLFAAVALVEFGYPVVNNFALILSRFGL
ncbi:MAG: hypothetical protein LYZ69_06355 [Nitrososphaerales archaeon]|nr:hypothetical protein [Nitrososphaerales archaeon]